MCPVAAWQMDGRNLVGHGGSCPGYRTTLMIDPASETAIAVAMNAMDDPGVYARGLGGLLANRLAAEAYPVPEGDAVDLASFTGIVQLAPRPPTLTLTLP